MKLKKKRVASLILAAAISASLAVPAMATDPNTTWDGSNFASGTKSSFDVGSSTSGTKSDDIVYYVKVDWTMTPGDDRKTTTYNWNPETLQYSKKTTTSSGQQKYAQVDITVTNYSNATIYWKNIVSYTKTENGKYVSTHGIAQEKDRQAIGRDYDTVVTANGCYPLTSAAETVTDWDAAGDAGKGTATSSGTCYDVAYCNGYNADTYPIMETVTVKIGSAPTAVIR